MAGPRGRGAREFRCPTRQPGTRCKGDSSGATVCALPLSRCEGAIVCPACGLSCILQKGKGRGRDPGGREGGKLGEEEEKSER